jgi:hypothetical protein
VIEDNKLCVLGPAVRTRNDIYAFRLKTRPEKNRWLSVADHRFRIGVREKNLTTTDISRMILRRWSPDVYVLADFQEAEFPDDASYREVMVEGRRKLVVRFCRSHVRHVAEENPVTRLDRLLNGDFHVAIFMGEELANRRVKDSYQADILDAANLNRIIGNIYDTHLFPRVVYAIFRSHMNRKWVPPLLEEFTRQMNSYVASVETGRAKRTYPLGQQIQLPCRIGAEADINELKVLMQFTQDICHPEHVDCFMEDYPTNEDKKRVLKSRGLIESDFYKLPEEFQVARQAEQLRAFRKRIEMLRERIVNKELAREVDAQALDRHFTSVEVPKLLALCEELLRGPILPEAQIRQRIENMELNSATARAMESFVQAVLSE